LGRDVRLDGWLQSAACACNVVAGFSMGGYINVIMRGLRG